MKKIYGYITFLLLLIIISPGLFAQSDGKKQLDHFTGKSAAGISYSFGSTDLYSSENVIGGPTYSGKSLYRVGLWLRTDVNGKFDIQGSLSYTGNKYDITPAPTGGPSRSYEGNVGVFAVSVYARYHFLKYLYAGGGPLLGINTGDRDINGLGVGAIFGGEYTFSNRMVFSFGPFISLHGLLPEKTYKLLNLGIVLSIGYKL
jgi:hypothetical protein